MTEYTRQYYLKNRDKLIAYTRKWKQDHPEETKIASGRYYRKSIYGMTDPQFQTMMLIQCGKCVICTEIMDYPHVDHNHETGQIRSLLCSFCNKGIGFFKENSAVLRAAAEYVEEYSS